MRATPVNRPHSRQGFHSDQRRRSLYLKSNAPARKSSEIKLTTYDIVDLFVPCDECDEDRAHADTMELMAGLYRNYNRN